ncbi:hypothetical protein [Nocardioides sp.]|uniref:hypothetical protein n=1 Tax=Nocardioides sp. TaxID=35761 RepID=UPI002ED38DEE
MGKRLALLCVVLLLVLAGVLGAVRWWQTSRQSDFQQALSVAPAGAQRVTYTDWAGIRRELGADVGAGSSTAAVAGFLDDAFEADLSPMSALLGSAEAMHEEYGFSPATLDWELLSQSEEGAAVVMRLPESTDLEATEERLEALGYQRPEEDGGVWIGGVDLLPTIGTVTPELQFLAIDADRRLVVGSDTEGYLEQAMETVTGDAGPMTGLDPVIDAVAADGGPLAAAVYDGPQACSALAMGSADEADQDHARELIAAAGDVNPLTGFAMAVEPGLDVRVAMSFENEEQARTNADTRAVLAAGPAPGQGGDFTDRFRVGKVSADGSVVTMELEPREGEYVLSDLTSGPVLFATC